MTTGVGNTDPTPFSVFATSAVKKPLQFASNNLRSSNMTADEFREIALSFPATEERSHMNHPDFRVSGKIFASLGPDET